VLQRQAGHVEKIVGSFRFLSRDVLTILLTCSADSLILHSLLFIFLSYSVPIYLSIYLSIYVCSQIFSATIVWLGNQLPPGIAYLQIAYSHTAGVCNIFPGPLCRCSHYSLFTAVKIYHRHRRMRSSRASQENYRLVLSLVTHGL